MPRLAPNFEVVEEDSPGYSLAELTRFAFRLFRDRLEHADAPCVLLEQIDAIAAIGRGHCARDFLEIADDEFEHGLT